MSSELENKIEKLFLSKSKLLETEELQSLIKESYNKKLSEKGPTPVVQQKQTSSEDIMRMLPKFEFNETIVGKIDTEDRKQFEMFMGSQIKAADNLKSKIEMINKFAGKPAVKSSDTQSILSSLMMLKILKNIVVGSSPGPAGLQFEAFFAALFGGAQIPAQEGGAVDVVVEDKKYQLKLLQPGGRARIARSNIEKLAEDVGDNTLPQIESSVPLNFIIANKLGTSEVVFYVLENVKPVVVAGKKEYVLSSNEYAKTENLAGRLNISDKAFTDLSQMLKNNVTRVLSDTASLVNNINQFYFNNDTNAARNGIGNANSIGQGLKRQTK